jgi:hypothetical protein
MNDAWYESLTKIKNDSGDNAIITSWWDYGHWFTAIAERKVTFDGGDQGERIHWVGKILLTNNEKEAIGILRMLNCGQEQAPHVLEKYLNGDTVKAIKILDEIDTMNKAEARTYLLEQNLPLEAVQEVLNVTHCKDVFPQYFITSADMVTKAPVWGRFGSWNFEKAFIYKKIKNSDKEKAVRYLTQQFNFTREEAENVYFDVQATELKHWVSEEPFYISPQKKCNKKGDKLTCKAKVPNGIITFMVDLTTMDATVETTDGNVVHPSSFVYTTKEAIEEKKYEGSVLPLSFILMTDGKGTYKFIMADPLLGTSTFTKLMFFRGHGMNCFDLFDIRTSVFSGDIIVWKVDWECQDKNNIFSASNEKSKTMDANISIEISENSHT